MFFDPSLSKQPRSFRRRLASSGLWSTIGRVASIASVVINYRLVCKTLDQSQVSLYVVSIGLVALGTLMAAAGLGTAMLRRVSSLPIPAGQPTPLIPRSLATRIAGLSVQSWLIVASGMGLVFWLNPMMLGRDVTGVLAICVAWIGLRVALILMTEAARGAHRYSLASMMGGQQEGPLVNGLVLLMLLAVGNQCDQARDVLILHVISTAAITLYAAVKLRSSLTSAPEHSINDLVADNTTRLDTDEASTDDIDSNFASSSEVRRRDLWAEGLKVLVSQLAIYGLVEFETLLVGRYCDDAQIGTWGAIRRLMAIVSGPLLLINAAIPSFVSELYGRGERSKLETLLRATATAATPVAIVAFAALYFFGDHLLGYFDPAYAEVGYRPLLILTAANVVFVAAGSAGLTLRMANRQGWATATTFVLSIAYIAVAPAVITRYGILGAATMGATVIVIRNVIATLLVRRFIGVWCTPTANVRSLRSLWQTIRRRKGSKKQVVRRHEVDSVAD